MITGKKKLILNSKGNSKNFFHELISILICLLIKSLTSYKVKDVVPSNVLKSKSDPGSDPGPDFIVGLLSDAEWRRVLSEILEPEVTFHVSENRRLSDAARCHGNQSCLL